MQLHFQEYLSTHLLITMTISLSLRVKFCKGGYLNGWRVGAREFIIMNCNLLQNNKYSMIPR